MSKSTTASASARATPRRLILRLLERIFAILGLLFVTYHSCFHLSVLSSGSMSPTLRGESLFHGDTVLTEKVSFWFRKPHRWEVVLFFDEMGVQVMKRVVGLPGETISLKDTSTVLINGQPTPRPSSMQWLKYYAYGLLTGGKAVPCNDGYFVLGDDSRDSEDSRYTGPLRRDQIKGRAWLIVWPPSRIRFINR